MNYLFLFKNVKTAKLLRLAAIIRRFLRDCDVVRVALVHARCGDLDEAGVMQLLDGV